MSDSESTTRRAVLAADDSRTIRTIVELTLQDAGFAVETAGDGGAALGALQDGEYAVVLADVAMPGPTGYELCRRIKTSARPVPVLLLVGSFEEFDAERAGRCGADGWLVKPFEPADLRARVDALLELESPARADPDEAEELTVRSEPGPEATETPPVRPSSGGSPESLRTEPSPELVDAVARAVVGKLSREVLRDVARDVVPDLAARIIRERLAELEQE